MVGLSGEKAMRDGGWGECLAHAACGALHKYGSCRHCHCRQGLVTQDRPTASLLPVAVAVWAVLRGSHLERGPSCSDACISTERWRCHVTIPHLCAHARSPHPHPSLVSHLILLGLGHLSLGSATWNRKGKARPIWRPSLGSPSGSRGRKL